MWSKIKNNSLFILDDSATSELLPNFKLLGTRAYDGTLEATLKVVYRKKLIEGAPLNLYRKFIKSDTVLISDVLAEDSISTSENIISVINIDNEKYDETDVLLEQLEAQEVPDYELCKQENKAMKDNEIPFLLYKNKKIETNYLWVVAGNMYPDIESALSMLIPWALPWLLSIEEIQADDYSREIIVALQEGAFEKFIDIAKTVQKELGFDKIIVKEKLDNFENRILESNKNRTKTVLGQKRTKYREYIECANRLIEEIRSLEFEDFAYSYTQASYKLGSYFANSGAIEFVDVDNDTLTFDIIQDITTFDSDMYERYRDSSDNYMSGNYGGMGRSNLRLLTDAIFETQKLVLVARARISLSTTGHLGGGDVANPTGRFANAIPHPHIVQFNCFGGFSQLVSESVAAGNYVDAINVLASASSNFNIVDTTVGEHLWSVLAMTENKCIRKPDGEMVTPHEAVVYLKGDDNE
jgi:hypothetical protein